MLVCMTALLLLVFQYFVQKVKIAVQATFCNLCSRGRSCMFSHSGHVSAVLLIIYNVQICKHLKIKSVVFIISSRHANSTALAVDCCYD